MDRNLKHNLEKIFRDSSSIDQIFDAFQVMIAYKIKDINLFQALIANPSLIPEEITMFADKLAKTYKTYTYDIYFWTAEVFETKFGCTDYALNYYFKAFNIKPFKNEPLIALLMLYNYEYETQSNNVIIEFINSVIEFIEIKSPLYYQLASHYLKIGDNNLASKYEKLAEKHQRDEEKED